MDLGSLVNRAIYSRKYQQENPPSQAYNQGLLSGGMSAFTQIPRLIADLYAKGGGVPDPNNELPRVQQEYLQRKSLQEAMKQKLMQDPSFAQGYSTGETLGGFVDPISNLVSGGVATGVIAAGRNVLRAARGIRGYSPLANQMGAIVLKDGKPRPFYHGTQAPEFKTFDDALRQKEEHGWTGSGHYLTTNREMAENYSQIGSGQGRVIEANLDLDNPIYSNSPEFKDIVKRTIGKSSIHNKEDAEKITQALREAGYDAVITGDYDAAWNEVNVFDSKRIKIKKQR